MLSTRMKNLHPYVPGEQPKDREYIKLNANENPYPPCKQVSEAVAEFVKNHSEKIALYPDPDSSELKSAVAQMLNVTGGVLCNCTVNKNECSCSESDKIGFEITPEMIYVGNGSDEVLSFLFYAFIDSSEKLVLPKFTYSFYPVYAGFYGIPLDTVPMNDDWSLNTEEMLLHAQKNNSSIIFANPNAPSGIALKRSEIRQMLLKANSNKIFIVDEAYCDFGEESCIPLLKEFKNLVIVRTFSKSLCAAGSRLGYAVASPELINAITTVKNSLNHFPVDSIAQELGKAVCKNLGYYAACAKKIVEERNSFTEFLLSLGWEVVPSKTNFVLAKNPKVSGEVVYKKIKEKGILVRHFSTPGIEDYVRITIGTKEQMEKLKNIIKTI